MIKSLTLIVDRGCPWNQSNYLALAFPRVFDGEFYIRELGQKLPNTNFYLWVDNGCNVIPNSPPYQTIWYFIDGYNRSFRDEWYKQQAQSCYKCFEATQLGLEWIRQFRPDISYWPLGFSADYMWHECLPKQYDVIFCGGRRHDGMRGQILNEVRKNFNLFEPIDNTIYNATLRDKINQSKVFLDIPPVENPHLEGQRLYEGFGCRANMVTMDGPRLEVLSNSVIDPTPFLYNNPSNVCNRIAEAIKFPIEPSEWLNIVQFSYDKRIFNYFMSWFKDI